MATGIASWSQTAASNGTADSSINMAEGMAPSAVNDGIRALMGSGAKWRDDHNGTVTTGGTSTAYTVTSNQGMALTAGYEVAFSPHVNSGATVTLNADTLGAKPLRSAPNTELVANDLVAGVPYRATYFASNSGEWILHGSRPFVASGEVVQRVYAATTTGASTSGGAYVDSNVTATITPTSASNTIKVTVNQQVNVPSGPISCYCILVRGSTQVAATRRVYLGTGNQLIAPANWCVIDSPATTGATIYKTQFHNDQAGTVTIDNGEILLEEIKA